MLAGIGIMRALAKSGSNACATLRWSHESLKRIKVSQIFINEISFADLQEDQRSVVGGDPTA